MFGLKIMEIAHLSFSNRLRLHMFNAVCLTIVPTTRLLITIPSTKGVARFVLENYRNKLLAMNNITINVNILFKI